MRTQPLPESRPVCRDPDDDDGIAAALAASAEYIVTGDRALLVLAQHERIRILSARASLEALARGYRHSGLLLENGAENPNHNLSSDFQISNSFRKDR